MPDINQERDNQDSAYTLLGVLLKYAPDDAAQAKTSRLYNEAQYHGAYGKSLALTVASWICDGLRYGNWPWNSPDGQVHHDAQVVGFVTDPSPTGGPWGPEGRQGN